MSTDASANNNAAGRIIFFSIILSIAYAVVRYHILGPVPWDDFPFFILNKGISLAAFLLLTLNFSLGPIKNIGLPVPDSWLSARKILGMTGFLLVLIHALMSFMLFSPAIYSKLFEADGSLTLFSGISMLGGVLSFVVLWGYNLSFQTHLRDEKAFIQFITSRNFLLFAMLLSAVHLFFMGFEGWLSPAGWHGRLPPISLVAFVVFAVGYLANLMGRK
ncbi:MAG: hypothetical protein QNL05_15190 [Gammaproteobacteria bacterium]|nr:hypothetical protein [Gammaproteobacteria bacterium]